MRPRSRHLADRVLAVVGPEVHPRRRHWCAGEHDAFIAAPVEDRVALDHVVAVVDSLAAEEVEAGLDVAGRRVLALVGGQVQPEVGGHPVGLPEPLGWELGLGVVHPDADHVVARMLGERLDHRHRQLGILHPVHRGDQLAVDAVVGAGVADAVDEAVDARLVAGAGGHVGRRVEEHLAVADVVLGGLGQGLVGDAVEVLSVAHGQRGVVVQVQELVDVRVVVEVLRLLVLGQRHTVLVAEVDGRSRLHRPHQVDVQTHLRQRLQELVHVHWSILLSRAHRAHRADRGGRPYSLRNWSKSPTNRRRIACFSSSGAQQASMPAKLMSSMSSSE